MGKTEIEAFLSHLATDRKVAASTQRQALNALVFLYRHVLDKPIGDNIAPAKVKKRRHPPVVMTKHEVRQVLNLMKGTHLLMAKVMYGGGLRLKEYRWQYVFPAKNFSKDPRSDAFRRHHVLESGLQKAIKIAADRAGITKRVSTHTFRHSFATHLLEDAVNIRIVQELMGHADVKTTEIYTHVMEKDIQAVRSPLETL